MSKSTSITIRMDEELKKSMEIVCENLGINISTAVNMLAKKMVNTNSIPFEVSHDPFYSQKNIAWIEESIQQYKNNEFLEKENII